MILDTQFPLMLTIYCFLSELKTGIAQRDIEKSIIVLENDLLFPFLC